MARNWTTVNQVRTNLARSRLSWSVVTIEKAGERRVGSGTASRPIAPTDRELRTGYNRTRASIAKNCHSVDSRMEHASLWQRSGLRYLYMNLDVNSEYFSIFYSIITWNNVFLISLLLYHFLAIPFLSNPDWVRYRLFLLKISSHCLASIVSTILEANLQTQPRSLTNWLSFYNFPPC